MRKIYVQDLQPGMVLGKQIVDDRDRVLLARGVNLTPRYISVLQNLGYYAIYIQDGIADDVEPPDILGDRIRAATIRHVRQLFSLAQGSSSACRDDKSPPAPANLMSAAMPSVAKLYQDVERIIDQAASAQVLSGVTTLKTHDDHTFQHSLEMAVAGVVMGMRMHLQPFELHQLALGCLCHDIGKLTIPTEILNKPGPLTDEEWMEVRKHPDAGFEIVRQIMGTSDILARNVVWQHHERQDGTGYPRGLRGTNDFDYPRQGRFGRGLVLPAAEIAAVAEVYVSLASDQPYRHALPPAKIASILRDMSGTALNREVVKRFLSILPIFPIGSEVVVISGKWQGHRGVVTALNPKDLQRPIVRILFDSDGGRIPPVEVDNGEEKDMEIAAESYSDLASDGGQESAVGQDSTETPTAMEIARNVSAPNSAPYLPRQDLGRG